MHVLHNRTVPPGIYENITVTNLGEAIQGLLLSGLLPSRRSRLFRVLYNGRPLWLGANRTTFKTRASAKNAVITWLANGMHEVTATAVNSGAWNYWPHIYERMGLRRENHNYYSFKALLTRYVDALFEAGTLRYEAVNLDTEADAGPTESIVS